MQKTQIKQAQTQTTRENTSLDFNSSTPGKMLTNISHNKHTWKHTWIFIELN
ncbi:hypothetical protein O77CONTIG1_01893 [Leptolyngbya sp. O-77]|nr:hypothetical protein O77CONTIG1_01893 [Leptolyngbya sp. O-77]